MLICRSAQEYRVHVESVEPSGTVMVREYSCRLCYCIIMAKFVFDP
jgi:hypothetical protein